VRCCRGATTHRRPWSWSGRHVSSPGACFNSGQHDRAREVFEALLEVDPSSHFGHYALAQCLRKAGRVPEAVTHLRLACAMAPESALYHGALVRASASLPGPPTGR
jgi:predicted Zn-dependent protease